MEVEHPERFELIQAVEEKLFDELQVNGAVAPDVSRNVPVNALISGRVIDVRARLYDDVQKGQMLLRMISPDLSQAVSDYRKFQADEVLARRQLERSQLLLEHGADDAFFSPEIERGGFSGITLWRVGFFLLGR